MCGQGKKEKSGEKTENRSFAVERKMILWCPAPLKGNMQPNRSVGKGERFFFGLGRALGDGKVFPFVFHWRLRHFFPPNSDHFAGVSHFTVAKISSRESDAGFLSQFQESIQGLSWIRPFSYMKHYAVKICYSLVAFRFS